MATIRRYCEDLIITLGANEVFTVQAPSRVLFRFTMAADQLSGVAETVPITQHEPGTDIGNTGWLKSIRPTEAERADQRGVDHEIKPGPKRDIRGGTKR